MAGVFVIWSCGGFLPAKTGNFALAPNTTPSAPPPPGESDLDPGADAVRSLGVLSDRSVILRKNSLILFGLGGAVLGLFSLFLRDRRVGVNLPAPNIDGNLDLVDSAITQCHLK